jgi:hypothetical protein
MTTKEKNIIRGMKAEYEYEKEMYSKHGVRRHLLQAEAVGRQIIHLVQKWNNLDVAR